MKRFFQWGMVERIALVLLCAVFLELLGNFALYRWQNRELVSAAQTRRIAEQLVDAVHVASAAPQVERAMLVESLNIDGLAINWVPRTVLANLSPSLSRLGELQRRLIRFSPELAKHELRMNLLPARDGKEHDLIGTMRLGDGTFVTFRVSGYLGAPPGMMAIVFLHVLLVVAVMGLALLMVHALVRPLRDLARAADETGRNHAARITPAGPHEVRRVASAFAAMQTRLLQMMEDNTQALIAVSHDLRTPIQRLQLRAGLLREDEERDAISHDLSEMERFIDATLAHVRSGMDEPSRLIDVSALISTIVDDACDTGADAVFEGPDSMLLAVRATALKRVLYNLLDNSRKYAGRVYISLSGQEMIGVEILVEDDGPGIPPELYAKALRPFTRLDPDFSADPRTVQARGGGLGLAFVQRAVQAHNGTLTLGTSKWGGLSIHIYLPAAVNPDSDAAAVSSADANSA